jgi:ABC-type amino acid transport system permease subunit
MIQIIVEFHQLFFQGFLMTLKLLGLIVLIGVPLGTLLGTVGARYSSGVDLFIKVIRFVTKVVPVLVLLFWLHYPLQGIFGIVVNPFWTVVLALGAINTIGVAHLVSTELQLLPNFYREAGITLGMRYSQIIWYIELPLLVRRVLPSLLLLQAAMLEYTLFASLISVQELFRVAQTINSMIYRPVAIYSILVVFFFVILAPLHLIIFWIKKSYATHYA